MAKSNNASTNLVIVAISLVLIAGAVWWFLDTYERFEKEVIVGFSGEAARNPYYAAELFLRKYQTEVEPVTTILDMNEMPDTNDILFIPTKRFDIGQDRLKEIMRWVENGGHLIALARYASKKDEFVEDALFEELGVTTHRDFDVKELLSEVFGMFSSGDEYIEEDKPEDAVKDKSGAKDEKSEKKFELPEINREPLTVKGTKLIEDKQVIFIQSRWMEYADKENLIWEIPGQNGAQLLEYRIGDGRVTLLSDVRFMLNSQISKHDHASFLHMLVHVDDNKRKLWLIKHGDSPSLMSILFDKAAPAMYSFLVFISVWIWYASRRFGPVNPNPEPVRRSMREHIESTGHYQWRTHNRNELLESVHKALHEQIAQSRPLWVKLSEDELSEKLARLSKLDKQKVYKAITTKMVDRELEFSALIETLSILRKKL